MNRKRDAQSMFMSILDENEEEREILLESSSESMDSHQFSTE